MTVLTLRFAGHESLLPPIACVGNLWVVHTSRVGVGFRLCSALCTLCSMLKTVVCILLFLRGALLICIIDLWLVVFAAWPFENCHLNALSMAWGACRLTFWKQSYVSYFFCVERCWFECLSYGLWCMRPDPLKMVLCILLCILFFQRGALLIWMLFLWLVVLASCFFSAWSAANLNGWSMPCDSWCMRIGSLG